MPKLLCYGPKHAVLGEAQDLGQTNYQPQDSFLLYGIA